MDQITAKNGNERGGLQSHYSVSRQIDKIWIQDFRGVLQELRNGDSRDKS